MSDPTVNKEGLLIHVLHAWNRKKKCPSMISIHRTIMPVMALVVTHLILSCAPPPSESDVAEAISRYFESQGYGVEELVISEISSQPISELKYMGTKGYHVRIGHVTLVIDERRKGNRPYTQGKRVTLTDGMIVIREGPSRKKKWVISSVSSNLMP